MIITVQIGTQSFEIDCDTGTQDIAWLSLCACNLYGQNTFPITTYLPIMAKNQSGQILHPKLVIVKSQDLIGDIIKVDVRKKANEVGSEMSNEQKEWFGDAFGEGRFKMLVLIKFKPNAEIRKDNRFKLEFSYDILQKLSLFFPEYSDTISIEVTPKSRRNDLFEGEMKIPFGSLKPKRILFCNKSTDVFDKETTDFIKNDIQYQCTPEILNDTEKENYLRAKEDKIRDKEIKIKENILNAEKEKKEEEERFEQLKKYMTQIPYTLEEVYFYVKDQIDMNEQDLVEIFELLERNEYYLFRKLFEIFFDYCRFYDNNSNLTVDALSVTNFLNLFFSRRTGVEGIAEEFQNLYLSRLERDGTEIDFKEFIYIIIFLLYNIMIHKDINICREIESIGKTYEVLLESDSYHELNKNIDIIAILNANYSVLKGIFNKYGIRKERNEASEMTGIQFLNFVSDVSKALQYDLVKMSKDDVKTMVNIDYFDFLRKIIAIALNLSQKPEKEEENNSDLKNDIVYIGLSVEKAVEKLVDELKKLYRG